ncbi:hypothetical protein BDV24DRAFT_122609, partial [Aspergillus arachidicola]
MHAYIHGIFMFLFTLLRVFEYTKKVDHVKASQTLDYARPSPAPRAGGVAIFGNPNVT